MNAATQINFELLNPNDSNQVNRLQSFASTFDHAPLVTRTTPPILIIKEGDTWVGYTYISHYPTFFPAWHPSIRPSILRDAILSLRGWAQIQHGYYHIAIDKDHQTFTPDIMGKLGFKQHGSELFIPN